MHPSRLEAPPAGDDWLPRIDSIFGDIDRAYQAVAEAYGFRCRSCEETCCRSHFYHHTFLEFFFLREGFRQMPANEQQRLARQAQRVCKEVEAGAEKILCPVNSAGRCRLYRHRPMICRLHGIPHKLHHPVRGWIVGPGCELFSRRHSSDDSLRIDRTPHYRRVAQLEQEMKAALGLQGRIRMTVAEMVTQF